MKKLLFLPVLFLFLACGSKSELKKKKDELSSLRTKQLEITGKIAQLEKEIAVLDTTKFEEKPKLITVGHVEKGSFNHYIDVQGMVDSEDNISIQASMPGIVTRVLVTEGTPVTAGQVLAEVDNRTIRESIAQMQTNISFAKTTFEKQQRLWDQKIGSEIQFLQAKTQYESLQSSLAAMQAQLDMSRIKSPITGVVDAVHIKVGEFAAPGFGIFRVVNSKKLKITAKVADSYLSKVKMGAPVNIYLKDLGDSLTGHITFISKSVDPATRTFMVEIKLPENEKDIRPNMLASISINDERISDAISVPSNLIQKDGDGKNYIYVAQGSDKGMKALKRFIAPGISYGDKTVINEGIKEDAQLITSGYQEVVDGQPVTLN